MSSRHLYIALLLGLGPLSVSQPVTAVECESAIQLGSKPAMDDYADYSDFLVAIMDYKAHERDLRAQQEACPELFVKRVDPASLDPRVTYGPETLDSALERTARLPMVDYRGASKLNDRSTARSFALPTLASTEMESEAIRTPLRTIIDGNIDERDQQLALNLQGPLPADDGIWGPDFIARGTSSTLFEREREAEIAFDLTDSAYDSTLSINYPNGGYLTVYYRGTNIVLMRIFQVACLGPC